MEDEACDNFSQEQDDDREVAYADQGLSIVVQMNLKVSCIVDDDNWIRNNVFHTKCTSHGRVCMMIIHSGSFENVVSREMIQKLKLETISHPNPYQLCWLQKGNEIKVSKRCLVFFNW